MITKIRVERRDDDDLRVHCDGFDSDLDDVLIKVLKPAGWELWASGFSHVSSERDLAFEPAPSQRVA